MEKLHDLKSQPIFSEASQLEGLEPFDFPTGISGFPMYLVSFLRNLVTAVKEATASPKQSHCTIARNTFPVYAQPQMSNKRALHKTCLAFLPAGQCFQDVTITS